MNSPPRQGTLSSTMLLTLVSCLYNLLPCKCFLLNYFDWSVRYILDRGTRDVTFSIHRGRILYAEKGRLQM